MPVIMSHALKTRIRILIAASVAFAAVPLAGQLATRPLVLDDLAKLRRVADPQVSPDGKWVAYTVETTDVEKDKHDTDLWMVSWDGSAQLRLTSTSDADERMPRWSPDNRYLAFLASRGDAEHKKLGSQVWLLNRGGGEAQELTKINGGVSDFAWSPDSKHLVLVVHDPNPNDDPEKKEGWKRKTAPPIVIDRYHFKQDREGYLQDLHSHLAIFDLDVRKAEPLVQGRFDEHQPAWSPDGKRIAFISNRSADPDRNDNTNLYVVDARPGAEPRQVTTFAGTNTGRPAWSPDGGSIAYFQGEETKYLEYGMNKVAVVPAGGGEARIVAATLDRPAAGSLVWTSDGRNLLFVVQDDRVAYVAKAAVAGGLVEKLTSGRRVVSNLSRRDDQTMALVVTTATEPGEVFALENGSLRRLTHQNDDVVGSLQLATTEDFTSRSKDGTEVHGIVVKPAGYTPGRKYPMLLLIHGGPNGQDEHAFSFDRQFFAANGYVVISVNYRGSSGRGAAYQKAIFADWGNKEVMDLLGAVDYMIATGVADPDRLGIGGWSYGGILTDYTIATDRRFKAAVSGAGTANPLGLYGVDQYILQYDNEIGPPWKAPEIWTKISYPFLHADRIRTPTLFLGGEKDFNVPLVGGEQMYQALKSLNVDTELVIYPGQYHSITTPSYQRDRLERDLAWFNRYLRPDGSARPSTGR
jgi:dipeptidyl aminopeptidase/acylaminoacyl peptidase